MCPEAKPFLLELRIAAAPKNSEADCEGHMETVTTIKGMRSVVAGWRNQEATVGLVPTMGGLHDGHISLIELARKRVDRVIATLFVNPAQFSPNEDFDAYPRDEDADLRLFKKAGVDLVFLPSVDEMYPPGHVSRVHVQELSNVMEGEYRPQFFSGVATVVGKLLIQAMADIAVFGEKDYQQLQIIRRMARDFDIPTEILGAPTVREDDGLAMSSRNRYLKATERSSAGKLYESISNVAKAVRRGSDPMAACSDAANFLTEEGFHKIEYLRVLDAETFRDYQGAGRPGRVFVAAWLGKARLIDNIAV